VRSLFTRIRDFVPRPGRGVRRTLALSESWESQNQSELEEINVSTWYQHTFVDPFFVSSVTLQPSSICGLAAASSATSAIVFAAYGPPTRILQR
jgi:hypothetical protein